MFVRLRIGCSCTESGKISYTDIDFYGHPKPWVMHLETLATVWTVGRSCIQSVTCLGIRVQFRWRLYNLMTHMCIPSSVVTVIAAWIESSELLSHKYDNLRLLNLSKIEWRAGPSTSPVLAVAATKGIDWAMIWPVSPLDWQISILHLYFRKFRLLIADIFGSSSASAWCMSLGGVNQHHVHASTRHIRTCRNYNSVRFCVFSNNQVGGTIPHILRNTCTRISCLMSQMTHV